MGFDIVPSARGPFDLQEIFRGPLKEMQATQGLLILCFLPLPLLTLLMQPVRCELTILLPFLPIAHKAQLRGVIASRRHLSRFAQPSPTPAVCHHLCVDRELTM